MKYHLAQINIAKFRQPREHSANADFFAAINKVNTIAAEQPGFVWRWSENDLPYAEDLFGDKRITMNMSVWESAEALGAFVYRQADHHAVFSARKNWFDKLDTYLALWWVPIGYRPSIEDGKARLDHLKEHGPSDEAFTLADRFPPPG